MVPITRQVKKILGRGAPDSDGAPCTLKDLRDIPAWVLLGEPGAGKTSVLQAEAVAVGGHYTTVAHFLSDPIDSFDPIGPQGSPPCLFLDGLDEARMGGSSGDAIKRVRSRLIELGRPNFRIACRAADWYHATDSNDLRASLPDGQVQVFDLMPLTETDSRAILKQTVADLDADDFFRQANTHRIGELMGNPLMLKLLADAARAGKWPHNRSEVYERACQHLVSEHNPEYQRQARCEPNPISEEVTLHAAGELFAAMLLGDKAGVALDPAEKDEHFPLLSDYRPKELGHAQQALQTRLFVRDASTASAKGFRPMHRSVAEYLAACWLGRELDDHRLSRLRLLRLMTGYGGKVVSSLRGLYGWLATVSVSVQRDLVRRDPETVAFYGDPMRMGIEIRRSIFKGLCDEIQSNPGSWWHSNAFARLTGLFDPGLCNDFKQVLNHPGRDHACQTQATLALQYLDGNEHSPALRDVLMQVIEDSSRWERVRQKALNVWMSGAGVEEKKDLLQQFHSGRLDDPGKTLTGRLLIDLFPKDLGGVAALEYLQPSHFKGLRTDAYEVFWGGRYPENVSPSELPDVLSELAQSERLEDDPIRDHWKHQVIGEMITILARRTLDLRGDESSIEQIFGWMQLGIDFQRYKDPNSQLNRHFNQWLADRPQRYYELLGLCYARHENEKSPMAGLMEDLQVMEGIDPPNDLGQWHWQQLQVSRKVEMQQIHLKELVRICPLRLDDAQTTLDRLFDWAGADPDRVVRLNNSLVCEWSGPNFNAGTKAMLQEEMQEHLQEEELRRKEYTETLRGLLSDIRTGRADAACMGELGAIWLNRYVHVPGDTIHERLTQYCNIPDELENALKLGLPACLNRSGLPTVSEILELSLNHRFHLIRSACFAGLEILWAHDRSVFDTIDEATAKKMIAFGLTDGEVFKSGWFLYWVEHQPVWVAQVWVELGRKFFQSSQPYGIELDPLAMESNYEAVARLAVPAMLKKFPTRVLAAHLPHLNVLLKTALKYNMPELAGIVVSKVRLKTLDPGPKVSFLMTGIVIGRPEFESMLVEYIDGNWQRAECVADFLGDRFTALPVHASFSASMCGRLIRLWATRAELEPPQGVHVLSQAMRLGLQVQTLINHLEDLNSDEALPELNALLSDNGIAPLHPSLWQAKHRLILKRRENEYAAPDLAQLIQVLRRESPGSAADLKAVVLDALDEVADDIHNSNANSFRLFWNEDGTHKSELACRDALLNLLRPKLSPLGIQIEPESVHVGGTQVDLQASFQGKWSVPIELKGDWSPDLWTAIENQLVPRYTKARQAQGVGVYCVFWTASNRQPTSKDGGKKASKPDDLSCRLGAAMPSELKGLIDVRVIDVTKPNP